MARSGALLLVVLGTTGCVERLLQVRSDPPGASVFVNGKEVGKTPCDYPFAFYGTVDVAMRLQGHELHREVTKLHIPWYELFPLDFFAEFLWPGRLRDVHTLEASLVALPATMPAGLEQDLATKAASLRAEAISGE